jgi:flagellar basal-body rod protein FlgF
MLKGLYAAASSMIANMDRQTILSHNITNLTTPGFKQIITSMQDWQETSVMPAVNKKTTYPFLPTVYESLATRQLRYIGEVGLGSETTSEEDDFSQGSLLQTDQPLDFAIEGEGFFFVRTPEGDRYTRDGRFMRDSAGNLVTAEGNFCLDEGGAPMVLAQGEVAVALDGTIMVNNQAAGKIGFVNFLDPKNELERAGNNLFSASGSPTTENMGQMHQGFTEGSNVNIADMTTQMTLVARSYEAAKQLVATQDQLLGKSISVLGQF